VQQIVFISPGRVTAETAADPAIESPTQAIVRPLAIATCDLDVALLHGRVPMQGPFPLGHEGVFEVVDVGEDVRGHARGDVVAVPYHVSCGGCPPCRHGRTAGCTGHGGADTGLLAGQCYGLARGAQNWGGFLADRVRVPFADHMLVPIPAGVEPVTVASASDNIADGWRTVAAPLAAEPGAPVLVVGGSPSIGLYAAAIAVALGSEHVAYVDDDPDRLQRAALLGVHPVDGLPKRLGPYPVTVDAGAQPERLALALRSTAPGGTCTSIGIYYAPTELPLLDMFLADITFRTGMAHSRTVMPDVLDLVATGRLHPEIVTQRVVGWDDAVAALGSVTGKLVITGPAPSAAAA
jgi:threonine dehydrogenase-like Zn-dependent dehydrogenase